MKSIKPIRKAVFPVGGLGTRFLPATKAMPKEMLPVVDKPLIQYAVEEARAAGIEQIIFVTGRGKSSIEDHFDYAGSLIQFLSKRAKHEELVTLEPIHGKPGDIAYMRQQEPLGLGHAIWCARHLIGDEPFAILLADDLILSRRPCIAQMIESYNHIGGNIVAAMDVPREHTHRYGIIAPGKIQDSLVEVKGLIEKPEPKQAPSATAVIGRYILQPEVLDILSQHHIGAGGEIQLTDAMAQLVGKQCFNAYLFEGTRFDCGDKASYINAQIAFALARMDISAQVRDYLKFLAHEKIFDDQYNIYDIKHQA